MLAEAEPGAPWKQRLDLLRGLILVRQRHVAEGRPLLQSAVNNMRREHPDDSASLVQQALQALQVQP